jgi:hypothetical protein
MRDVDLGRVAEARRFCESGGLRVLHDDTGVTWKAIARAVTEKGGSPVSSRAVKAWARGEYAPSDERALALFRVAQAITTAGV